LYNKLNTNESRCTPYGIANCLLFNYTTTLNGGNMILCLNYYNEYDAPTYGKYVVFQSPTYMKAILIEHPYYIQLLSFLNIWLHIQNQNWGFCTGKIIDVSLLNSLLLSWDRILNKEISEKQLSNIIFPILSQNLKSNQWYEQYMIVF